MFSVLDLFQLFYIDPNIYFYPIVINELSES